ncbi:MAG: carboxymuconolactone decarboxylase family protein [Theionarchaea archaeon]|nr:carboxymuconolactone decarboxylase family protein [Theionarchaea archaeon]
MSTVTKFHAYREKMNELILSCGNREMNRFFALDTAVYWEGVLPEKTKELLGLVASTVLRCNDCITYHLIQCEKKGVTPEELHEALSIALIVGGSITIPHIRYAFEICEELYK